MPRLCCECGDRQALPDADLCAGCATILEHASAQPCDYDGPLGLTLTRLNLSHVPHRWIAARIKVQWPSGVPYTIYTWDEQVVQARRAAIRHTFRENEQLANELGV